LTPQKASIGFFLIHPFHACAYRGSNPRTPRHFQLLGRAAASTGMPSLLLHLTACLDAIQIPSFFTLFITSIFNRLYGVLNVGKKNN
jgi:hypothetical protein